jgi:hypothetical protein
VIILPAAPSYNPMKQLLHVGSQDMLAAGIQGEWLCDITYVTYKVLAPAAAVQQQQHSTAQHCYSIVLATLLRC